MLQSSLLVTTSISQLLHTWRRIDLNKPVSPKPPPSQDAKTEAKEAAPTGIEAAMLAHTNPAQNASPLASGSIHPSGAHTERAHDVGGSRGRDSSSRGGAATLGSTRGSMVSRGLSTVRFSRGDTFAESPPDSPAHENTRAPRLLKKKGGRRASVEATQLAEALGIAASQVAMREGGAGADPLAVRRRQGTRAEKKALS